MRPYDYWKFRERIGKFIVIVFVALVVIHFVTKLISLVVGELF